MPTTLETVNDMCVSGAVKYLEDGETFHIPQNTTSRATAAAVNELDGVMWLPWAGDPLAQYTFKVLP